MVEEVKEEVKFKQPETTLDPPISPFKRKQNILFQILSGEDFLRQDPSQKRSSDGSSSHQSCFGPMEELAQVRGPHR